MTDRRNILAGRWCGIYVYRHEHTYNVEFTVAKITEIIPQSRHAYTFYIRVDINGNHIDIDMVYMDEEFDKVFDNTYDSFEDCLTGMMLSKTDRMHYISQSRIYNGCDISSVVIKGECDDYI